MDNERAHHSGDVNGPLMLSHSVQIHNAYAFSEGHLDILHKYSSIDEEGSKVGTQSQGSRASFFQSLESARPGHSSIIEAPWVPNPRVPSFPFFVFEHLQCGKR